jgi:hypothetical protein
MMRPSLRSTRELQSWQAAIAMHVELAAALKRARGMEPAPNAPGDDTWPTIDHAAFHGLAGEVVRTIDPHTEADPVAILIQLLVCFGNMVGRGPHYRVEADLHRGNLYAVLVGDSAKGRKGTSAGRVRSVVKGADEQWASERMKDGLSSGEGLIHEVRDESKLFNPKTGEIDTGASGMSRTTIRDLFGRHQSAGRIGAALALLKTNHRARSETVSTGGRPCEMWFAVAGST